MPSNADIKAEARRIADVVHRQRVLWDNEDDARRRARGEWLDGVVNHVRAVADQLPDGQTTPPPAPQDPTPQPPPDETPPDPMPGVEIPVYPALFGNVVQPGADLAKLTADSTLLPGDYVTSGDIKRNVVAQVPGTATLKLKPKQCPRLPDCWAGVNVENGGLPDNDDLKTSGTRAGGFVHSARFTGSEGYGLLVTGKSVVVNVDVDNNGSGGIGGTGTGMDALLIDAHVHHNNLKYRRTNSGGGKWTRGAVRIVAGDYHDNAGGDVWADNYVKLLRIEGGRFVGGPTDKSGDPWKRNNVRGEITQRLEVIGAEFANDAWAGICVNEVRDGFLIEGNTFRGKSKLAIEFRNMERDGFRLGGGAVKRNTFATNDLNLAHSGSGKDISLRDAGITIDASNRWPDGKVDEHIADKLD